MKKKIILFSSIAFFLITCTKVKGPVPNPLTASASDCDSAYWYNGIIGPIIIANCTSNAGCHGVGGSSLDYTTYAGVKHDVDNGTFKNRVLIVKDMPKVPGTPLSAAQLDRINCWLMHGAPATATGSTISTISYSSTIAPLIITNCSTSGCHDAASIYGDYTSYSGLKSVAGIGGKLDSVAVLLKGPTFPYTHIALSTSDISNIDLWIKQGALNN